MGAYTLAVSDEAPQDTRGTGDGTFSPKQRRRSPNPREQARRKAWAKEWGVVGAEYRRERLAREGKP